jgi:leader peptidase (prepilin peptidase) / N-methyltransferase
MTADMALAFGLGLLLGSFLNVAIHRMPRMIERDAQEAPTIERFDLCWPASHCPHCQTPLKIWHNIPVLSFLWLKGRCAFCHLAISWTYPAVELITALVWCFCAWHWGLNATGLCWAFFASLLIGLSIIDWQTTLLPDDLTQTLLWSGLLTSAMGWHPLSTEQSILGAVVGYTSLWLVATAFHRITGKHGMGAGDFKLLAALGAWLGPIALIPLVMLASLSGAIVGLWMKFTHRLREDGYVPFGPFLALAGLGIAGFGMDTISAWLGW